MNIIDKTKLVDYLIEERTQVLKRMKEATDKNVVESLGAAYQSIDLILSNVESTRFDRKDLTMDTLRWYANQSHWQLNKNDVIRAANDKGIRARLALMQIDADEVKSQDNEST
jgi:hypothetical protein